MESLLHVCITKRENVSHFSYNNEIQLQFKDVRCIIMNNMKVDL